MQWCNNAIVQWRNGAMVQCIVHCAIVNKSISYQDRNVTSRFSSGELTLRTVICFHGVTDTLYH